jgi:hypothetical protein
MEQDDCLFQEAPQIEIQSVSFVAFLVMKLKMAAEEVVIANTQYFYFKNESNIFSKWIILKK